MTVWSCVAVVAFIKCKHNLKNDSLLAHSSDNAHLALAVDVKDSAVGTVHQQCYKRYRQPLGLVGEKIQYIWPQIISGYLSVIYFVLC